MKDDQLATPSGTCSAHHAIWLLVWAASLCGPATTFAGPGLLTVKVVDASGELLPSRAWVEAGDQRLFQPVSPSTCTPYRRDRSFSCDGRFDIEVPAGRAIVHVERGKEYLPAHHSVEVAADQSTELTVTLHRWVNMPQEGWYSCDMHVHFGADDPRVLRQLALADDVHVTPAFTYWLRGNEREWVGRWPTWTTGAQDVIDATHLTTRKNVEIERIRGTAAPGGSVGASFLFNLDKPVTATRYGELFPTDTALCLAARKHSPDVVIDTDKPSWAETVVGAALGAYDTIQVCHNHYHRNQTIPGGWGMIGPIADGESNAAEGDGLFHRTNDLYYRFLNCGFRLGVSGGSAIGVMAVPMGYNRVYAHIDGPLTGARYWAAVKAGRSFATSGPMLNLTVNGQPPGETIHRAAGDASPVTVGARVRAIEPIEALQLVHDGRIVNQLDLTEFEPRPVIDRKVNWQVTPRRSGWLAARALLRAPDGRLRQAHTSPIYLIIDRKPIARKADARYMIQWIDRLSQIAMLPGRFPTDMDRQQVQHDYDQARMVYEKVASNAEQIWGD